MESRALALIRLEEKRLAKLEEEKLQKNKSKNINVDLEKKDKIIIFLNTTELVNNEKILDVNFSKNYFVSKNGSLDDEELQNYLNSYKKVYIIKKKDFIVNSSPGKKKNISSKYYLVGNETLYH